jgi:hypothetical protein
VTEGDILSRESNKTIIKYISGEPRLRELVVIATKRRSRVLIPPGCEVVGLYTYIGDVVFSNLIILKLP